MRKSHRPIRRSQCSRALPSIRRQTACHPETNQPRMLTRVSGWLRSIFSALPAATASKPQTNSTRQQEPASFRAVPHAARTSLASASVSSWPEYVVRNVPAGMSSMARRPQPLHERTGVSTTTTTFYCETALATKRLDWRPT